MTKQRPLDVAKLRDRLGWSQTELARFLGTTDRAISRWESEDVTPSGVVADLLKALVDVVQTSVGLDKVRAAADRGETMTALARRALEGGASGGDER